MYFVPSLDFDDFGDGFTLWDTRKMEDTGSQRGKDWESSFRRTLLLKRNYSFAFTRFQTGSAFFVSLSISPLVIAFS
jgi:hypothetical protein